MKRKLLSVTVFFACIIITATLCLGLSKSNADIENTKAEYIISLNEIEQLNIKGEFEQSQNKIHQLQNEIRSADIKHENNNDVFIIGGISLVFLSAVFGYVYIAVLKPFEKMKGFADEIAKGNFDIPLNYERSNYFGDFTWAFDCMRKEISKARKCEKEAVENNKTVIATLAHDIKTPIASIYSYAEALEMNLNTTPERRKKYLSVIMQKCREVSKLTDDLFLHSLSDLDKIRINNTKFEICSFTETVVSELSGEKNDILFKVPDFTAEVFCDKNRLTQIIENLVANSRKYAKTETDISVRQTDKGVEIRLRDYGQGIPDEDMPFIFEKFYRGKNCGNENGSGLGLYIVKYLIEKMNGTVSLHNLDNGLETVLFLPLQESGK